MKEFFRQHGLRILAVAAAVAVALSLLTYFSSTSSVLENIAGVLTYPFRAAATAVSDWAADKRQYYEDDDHTQGGTRRSKRDRGPSRPAASGAGRQRGK